MQQKENLPPQMNSDSSTQNDKIIELNVGGKVFMTKTSTFTAFEDSFLGKFFSGLDESGTQRGHNELLEGGGGRLELLQDSKGRYFLDADPQLFR